jgi:hypothetical protein
MGNAFDSRKKCEAAAMFMHDILPLNSTLIFCMVMFGIPLLCSVMGKIAKDPPPKMQVCSPASSLESRSSQDAANTAASTPKEEPLELSSAASFVLGSAVFSCICIMLFTLALCIQKLAYCPQYNADLRVMTVILWVLFTGEALAGSYAAGCWLVLLRDLWGQRGRELFPIQTYTLLVVVLTTMSLPFLLVGVPLVASVKKVQEVCGIGDFEGGGVKLDGETRPASGRVVGKDSDTTDDIVKVD